MRKCMLVVSMILGGALFAQTTDEQDLLALKSAKCEFPVLASSDWEKDDPAPTISGQKFGFHIDAIDRAKRRARIIGNLGAEDLALIVGDLGIHFLEITGSGNFNVTTIFAARSSDGRFKAVHSRHWIGGGAPLPSQTYGFCRRWD